MEHPSKPSRLGNKLAVLVVLATVVWFGGGVVAQQLQRLTRADANKSESEDVATLASPQRVANPKTPAERKAFFDWCLQNEGVPLVVGGLNHVSAGLVCIPADALKEF